MLALDLDLEADLGIDTVKQAELFATIREEYGIDRDDKLQLRDYPTLDHVVGFVRDRTATRGTTHHHRADRPCRRRRRLRVRPPPRSTPVAARIVALVAEQTGYPADMLALDLDLEADLGIDTVKQAELFATIRERIRHRPRRQTPTPRLPDPRPRRRLRPRPHRHHSGITLPTEAEP